MHKIVVAACAAFAILLASSLAAAPTTGSAADFARGYASIFSQARQIDSFGKVTLLNPNGKWDMTVSSTPTEKGGLGGLEVVVSNCADVRTERSVTLYDPQNGTRHRIVSVCAIT